jgi:hypothetical protein
VAWAVWAAWACEEESELEFVNKLVRLNLKLRPAVVARPDQDGRVIYNYLK